MKEILKNVSAILAGNRLPSIIGKVRADSLSFLEEAALNDLYEAVRDCEKNKIPGILMEAGCAAGGSAIVLTAAKSPSRKLEVFDVFGMIPPPSDADGQDVKDRYEVIKAGKAVGIGDRGYYGYETDLMTKVAGNFERHGYPIGRNNVELIKGLFEDTIQGSETVALAHLDGDWYDSVMVCLKRITPRLATGGRLVIDDYDAWSGCRRAVDDYFADKKPGFDFVKKARLHIVRK